MPKGLAFLSKKSWHTSKLCNQEKVWIAEQEKQAENIKIKELAKQIQKEREEEELNRISGKKSNRLDRGIDWMYQGGPRCDGKSTTFENEQKQKEHEDYLLGKEFNPDKVKKGDLATAESSVGVNMVLTRTAESTSVDQVLVGKERSERDDIQDWNSNFHLRHEDPMFMVEQQRSEIRNQKEKKQRLFDIVNDKEDPEVVKRKDRDRKRRKTEKHRKSRRERGDDDDDSSERKQYRKESKYENRRRSYSSESEDSKRHRKGRKYKHRSSRRNRRSSTSDSRSRSPDDNSSSGRHYGSHRRRNRSGRCSRSRDRDDFESRHGVSYQRRNRSRDEKVRSRSIDKDNKAELSKSYGLMGKSKPKSISTSDLGPDQALVEQKWKEQVEARGRHRRIRAGDCDSNGKQPMSESKRLETLKAMQADASARSRNISNAHRKSNTKLYDEEIQRRKDSGGGNASFLQDAAKKSRQLDQSSRASQNRNVFLRNKDDDFL